MRWFRFTTSVFLCLVSIGIVFSVAAASTDQAHWLLNIEPTITKLSDLPDNQEPQSTSIDCQMKTQPNGVPSCAYQTPLGLMTSGYLYDGPKGTYPYSSSSPRILPSVPGKPNLLLTQYNPPSWSYGMVTQVGMYDPSKLVFAQYNGYVREYQYDGQPTKTLTYKKTATTEENIAFAHTGVAYSQNGQWLVTLVAGGGIMVYDTTDFKGKLISWEAVAFKPGDTRGDTMAVSDDGRFVAVTLNTGSATAPKPSLRVYDVVSCSEQYPNLATAKTTHPCEYKDYWTGEYRTGNTRGIRDVLPAAEYPRRVRFVGNHTITFDTVYSRTSATAFKVARYSVTVPETTSREYVGLLALGDSYISGEGAAGTYFYGTDTKQNKCHLSMYSYPYRIGPQLFQNSRSVACSGAKMYDVTVASVFDEKLKDENEQKYGGQTSDRYDTNWGKRDRGIIITSFSPGYANQVIFAREYKPRTVLLSVGGNDINFAGILVSCIATDTSGTCYRYYEDRVQLMNNILGQYDRLVATYKDVMKESSGRLYVVGYPQIFKVGGNCGVNVRFNAAEIKFGSQLVTYLNSVIKRAAAEAGAYYVDTESSLNGYRLCEAPKNKAAVNGLTAGDDKGVTLPVYYGGILFFVDVKVGNESYHPTAFGHKLLSQKVLANTANLTAPMPAPRANNKPSLDYANALLQGVPKAAENQIHTEPIKWTDMNTKALVKGEKYSTNVPGGILKQGSSVKGVLRSDPVTLFEGTHSDDAAFIFEVPSEVPPGFHTLDIYGTTADGKPIDLRQVVYVAEAPDDFDGDGIQNDQESCLLVSPAGVDEDQDGVDDGCDGEVLDRSIASEQPPVLPPTNPLNLDTPEAETNDPYAGSVVRPYVEPQVNPTEENNPSQTNSGGAVPPSAGMVTAAKTELTAAARIAAGTLPIDFGFVPVTYTPDRSEIVAQPSKSSVLGSATPKAAVARTEQPKQNHPGYARHVVVLAAALLLAVLLRRAFRRQAD